MRRQELLLETTDGQYPAPQRDLSGHSQVATNFSLHEGRGNRRSHGDSGGRPVLRNGTFRHVDMDICFLVEILRQTKLICPGTNIGQSGLYGFLHNIAQFTGHDHLACPAHEGNLNSQEFAAYLCPGQTDG